MTEHIQLLLVFAELGNLREDIVASFYHRCDGMTAEVFSAARFVRLHLLRTRIYEAGDGSGIAYIAIIHIASNLPVVLVVGEVEGTHIYISLDILVLDIMRSRVAYRLAIVAAQSDAQSRNAVVIYTGCHGIFVGYFKLVWTLGTALNPVAATETEGVQACQELCFVTEFAALSPKLIPVWCQVQGRIVFSPSGR